MVVRLRELREARLLTQQELAVKAGVGVATIIRIEANQVVPHFRTLRRLATALEVEPNALIADQVAFSEARKRATKIAA